VALFLENTHHLILLRWRCPIGTRYGKRPAVRSEGVQDEEVESGNSGDAEANPEVAAQAFKSKGITATGVAEIMSAAGLTHGAFYRHFASKEQLVAEACATSMDVLVESAEIAAGGGQQLSSNILRISFQPNIVTTRWAVALWLRWVANWYGLIRRHVGQRRRASNS